MSACWKRLQIWSFSNLSASIFLPWLHETRPFMRSSQSVGVHIVGQLWWHSEMEDDATPSVQQRIRIEMVAGSFATSPSAEFHEKMCYFSKHIWQHKRAAIITPSCCPQILIVLFRSQMAGGSQRGKSNKGLWRCLKLLCADILINVGLNPYRLHSGWCAVAVHKWTGWGHCVFHWGPCLKAQQRPHG